MGFLIVFFGAGLGGAARHGVNLLLWRLGTGFSLSTLAINVSGSLVMGLLTGYLTFRGDFPPGMRLFLTTGVLGGFTTFSAFSLEAWLLYERGETGAAVAYVVGSVALAIGGLFAGLMIVRALSDV